MKTYHLFPLLVSILSFVTPVYAQFSFEFAPQKQGVSVVNKAGTNEAILKQEKLMRPLFEKAITNYIEALASTDHGLKKTLGPLQSPKAIATLKRIDVTVMMLDEADDLNTPTTWRLPTFTRGTESFVTKIPYKFLKENPSETSLEHLALHEIGHVVMGDSNKDDPTIDEVEEERRVEYLVYQVAGKEKYTEYITKWLTDKNQQLTPLALKAQLDNWMKFIGVSDDSSGKSPIL
jgi:hypothetical protein